MKLAVSNIAWNLEEEAAAAKLLGELGVRYIELAPTKRWPDLTTAKTGEITAYRRFWENQGFEVVAVQSIMFGRPELEIFKDQTARDQTLDFLKHVISLTAELGAKIIVFGSPKNRQRGQLSMERAHDVAVPFFHQVGEAASAAGVIFCIEPNAPAYACDFITTAAEGHTLVNDVASPGFDLHLDAACMTMVNDDAGEVTKFKPKHFHISSPMLGSVPGHDVPYSQLAAALNDIPYKNVVSIEMKAESDNLVRLSQAVKFSQSAFGA